jgi:hypothetical protein
MILVLFHLKVFLLSLKHCYENQSFYWHKLFIGCQKYRDVKLLKKKPWEFLSEATHLGTSSIRIEGFLPVQGSLSY